MKRLLLIISAALFLFTGCATHKVSQSGGFARNFESGAVFHSQYEIRTLQTDKKGRSIEVVNLFPADDGSLIPKNTISIYLGLYVGNPYRTPLTITTHYMFENTKSKQIYFKRHTSRHLRSLPEEILSIELPVHQNVTSDSIITFSVDVTNQTGDILYSCSPAKYRIGSKN